MTKQEKCVACRFIEKGGLCGTSLHNTECEFYFPAPPPQESKVEGWSEDFDYFWKYNVSPFCTSAEAIKTVKAFIHETRLAAYEEGRQSMGEEISGTIEKYHELIMAVARKFPNETRHETALRYIRQMEETAPEQEAKSSQEGEKK